jgi:tRNA(Ile)-lysidine synthase|uniref:tRNA(Ile)-lysidine synthase n=1 Tax=candidate division WOR-3 bacterium TaxID=2052148 RepID=A0A7C4TEX3_UNCW3
MANHIIRVVKETIDEFQMFENVRKAIIGFSSGPDSVCLLDVLKAIYGDRINFTLVYINHGLRNAKVLRKEERLTEYYANKYNCDFRIVKVKIFKGGKGIEAEAREKRYEALMDLCREISAQRIILGHNLDDLVETFFLNLVRGSGNIGLQAMPAVRGIFVRPLIMVKKVEILDYLKEKGLKYSQDITNRNIDIRRNFIRKKIIPMFLKLNPRIYEIIKREIDILHNDEIYFQSKLEKVFNKIVKREPEGYYLDLNRLIYYNKAIGNRLIMKVIGEIKGDMRGITSKHIEEIRNLNNKQSGKKVILPGGLYAQRVYGDIFIGYAGEKKNNEVFLKIGDEVQFNDLRVRAELVNEFKPSDIRNNREFFDFDQLCPPLFLRLRRPGDFVEIKIGRKKLKEILIEKRIPANKRDGVALLCDQKGILWVLGIYRAFRGFIKKGTKNILKVEFEYID